MLKCAIVGTGAVAHFHARATLSHPRARLVGITNRTRTKAEEFATVWGDPPVYDDLAQLLAEQRPDVVMICTSPDVHLEQARACFDAGAHVVVEKPPAPSLEELDEMRAAAAVADRQMAVMFQQRTGTAAAHFKQLLDSGALGRPLIAQCQTLWYRGLDYFAVPWRGSWETEGGGTTLGHSIHQLDLLCFLLGDWATVEGRLWRLDRETQTEDSSTATITFRNGVVATSISTTLAPRQVSAVRIDTQRATITVEHLYGHGHDNWSITPAPGVSDEEFATWALPEHEVRSDHDPLLHDVFDSILDGTPLPATADEPARSLEVVAAIYASAAADGAVITPEILAHHPTHRRSFESPVLDMRDTAHSSMGSDAS